MEEEFNEIIEDLSREQLYRDVCNTYTSNKYLSEELYQEFFMVILEYNKEKVIQLSKKNQLNYFCIGIIKRMATSSTSPFYTKIRKPELTGDLENLNIQSVDDEDDIRDSKNKYEERLEKIEDILDNKQVKEPKFWYKRTLFNYYFYEDLTYRQIEEMTSISHVSVYWAVREVKEYLKEELKLNV